MNLNWEKHLVENITKRTNKYGDTFNMVANKNYHHNDGGVKMIDAHSLDYTIEDTRIQIVWSMNLFILSLIEKKREEIRLLIKLYKQFSPIETYTKTNTQCTIKWK